MDQKIVHTARGERGQSFMELAISLVFLLVFLAAVIDLGWAFYTMIALRDTAQEGASYGAMCPDNPTRIRNRIVQSAVAPINMNDLQTANIEICIINPASPPPVFGCSTNAPAVMGNSVRVSVRIQHQILTPFVGTFIGTQSYPLTATVSNTILVDACATDN